MVSNFQNIIESAIGGNLAAATQAISAPANSPSQNISGCSVVSVQVVITAASSPGTASATLQASNDGTNWSTITTPAAQNITVNGALLFKGGDLVTPAMKFLRVAFACASGSYTATTTVLGKGPVN